MMQRERLDGCARRRGQRPQPVREAFVERIGERMPDAGAKVVRGQSLRAKKRLQRELEPLSGNMEHRLRFRAPQLVLIGERPRDAQIVVRVAPERERRRALRFVDDRRSHVESVDRALDVLPGRQRNHSRFGSWMQNEVPSFLPIRRES